MDTPKITNVLLFKEGYYYLTVVKEERLDGEDKAYTIAEGLDYNGFEFASDAYAYLSTLQKEVTS